MKSRPILFSAPMVQAIMDGRKTQTRRVLKPQPEFKPPFWRWDGAGWPDKQSPMLVPGHSMYNGCPYGVPGDRLWVREEHYRYGHWQAVDSVRTRTGRQKWAFVPDTSTVRFDAPAEFRKGRHHKDPATSAWHKRLARFMPRSLARIELEVTGLRVEFLQHISEEDAQAEGIPLTTAEHTFRKCFRDSAERSAERIKRFRELWVSINGQESWYRDPWVWVIESFL